MLVLTRKKNERFKLGDTVLTIVGVSGNKVRLGIEGDEDVIDLPSLRPKFKRSRKKKR